MRLGISSHAYGWATGVPGHEPARPMTALDLLDRASELGVAVVQVADNLPMHVLSEPELETFADRARRLGIIVELGTRGIRAHHIRPYLCLADRLQVAVVRTIVDTVDDKPSEDEIVDAIRGLVPELESSGICLALENHDRIQVRQMARIMERVGSHHVGICLDTVNSFGALESPELVVDTLGPWTVNLHLKDFAVERFDHMMGFVIEGRPLGRGRLDVAWLMAQLRAHGRDPNAILEQWTPPSDTLESTVAREAAWVAESVGYARRLVPS